MIIGVSVSSGVALLFSFILANYCYKIAVARRKPLPPTIMV